jgi:mersacidin/lichenicidin family type 2 lantibiotic
MSNVNIIRAWKDEEYSESLSREEQALIPQNPAGLLELSDQELAEVDGRELYRPDGICTCLFSCLVSLQPN